MPEHLADTSPIPRARRTRAAIGLLTAVALVAVVGGLWRFTELSEFAEADQVATWLTHIKTSPWAPLLIIGTYVVANAVMFPTVLLNIGVVLALGAVWGFTYAMLGSMVAGLVFYAVGRVWGRGPLERLNLRRLNRMIAMIAASGVTGLVVLRLVPIAPFPIMNAALGAAGIRSMPFTISTAIGMVPSMIAITAVGHQLETLTDDPGPAEIAMLAGIVIAALAGLYAVQRLARRKMDAVAP